ncbi:MAG: hypothetical protein R2851_26035 [Caldilineaceae bacterium]
MGVPLYRKLLANFTHLMALLLWVGGGIAFVGPAGIRAGPWLVNLINGVQLLAGIQGGEGDRSAAQHATGLRHRRGCATAWSSASAADLVPGDVMLLAEGDHISGRRRLARAAERGVDQSTSWRVPPGDQARRAGSGANLSRSELPNSGSPHWASPRATGAVVFATAWTPSSAKFAHPHPEPGRRTQPATTGDQGRHQSGHAGGRARGRSSLPWPWPWA